MNWVAAARRRRVLPFVVAGFALTLALAIFVSPFASSAPDGLERVAQDTGFLDAARESATADSPVADYGASGAGNGRAATGLAGLIGVLVTLAVALAVFGLIRLLRSPGNREARSGSAA